MNQEPIVTGVTGPGLVILSSSCRLLHMNRRALILLAELDQSAQSITTIPAITAPLHPHFQDIMNAMQVRLAAGNRETFHQYCIIGSPPDQILLKGFGLPDRRGLPHSRIVILLTPYSPFSTPTYDRTESPDRICEPDGVDPDSSRATGK